MQELYQETEAECYSKEINRITHYLLLIVQCSNTVGLIILLDSCFFDSSFVHLFYPTLADFPVSLSFNHFTGMHTSYFLRSLCAIAILLFTLSKCNIRPLDLICTLALQIWQNDYLLTKYGILIASLPL